MRHPLTSFNFDQMSASAPNSHFLIMARNSFVDLKGQMVPIQFPGIGGSGTNAMLFMCSPRVSGLDDMKAKGLFLSDIPLHDMSSDFILLAEQRKTEADLKERYEKMAVDLKVCGAGSVPAGHSLKNTGGFD